MIDIAAKRDVPLQLYINLGFLGFELNRIEAKKLYTCLGMMLSSHPESPEERRYWKTLEEKASHE